MNIEPEAWGDRYYILTAIFFPSGLYFINFFTRNLGRQDKFK